ncbi:hypothetical protein BDR03DRAFT_952399 [Suillus americanus]|nr:hypothetical protein BDR03DRAFT_952399 [Suillus americanus]
MQNTDMQPISEHDDEVLLNFVHSKAAMCSTVTHFMVDHLTCLPTILGSLLGAGTVIL